MPETPTQTPAQTTTPASTVTPSAGDGVTPPAQPQQAADGIAAAAASASAAVKTAEQIAADAAAKTPIEYQLALPKDAVIEAQAVERMTAFAKAHNLSPDAAQKALDHANAEVVADRAAQAARNAEAFNTLARETWVNEIKADKEFGGDKFDATVLESKRAADKFITAEEKQILNETGWGNHPMLVRFFARVGRMMGEDGLITGNGNAAPEPMRAADRLYGVNKKPS